ALQPHRLRISPTVHLRGLNLGSQLEPWFPVGRTAGRWKRSLDRVPSLFRRTPRLIQIPQMPAAAGPSPLIPPSPEKVESFARTEQGSPSPQHPPSRRRPQEGVQYAEQNPEFKTLPGSIAGQLRLIQLNSKSRLVGC